MFEKRSAIPPAFEGMNLYNLEDEFIAHPLCIESVPMPWHQRGCRIGRRGEHSSCIRFEGKNFANTPLRYDIPMSPRELSYDPFHFSEIYLRIVVPEPSRLGFLARSSYPEGADYEESDKILEKKTLELEAGLNIVCFSLEKYNLASSSEIARLTAVEIEMHSCRYMDVYAPLCLCTDSVAEKRLRKKYDKYLEYARFDMRMLELHSFLPERMKKNYEVLKERNACAELFAEWTRSIEKLYRLLGLGIQLEFMQKRMCLMREGGKYQSQFEKLQNQYTRLREDGLTREIGLPRIVSCKIPVDALETEIWDSWTHSGAVARREEKRIFTAEGERMSLMGINDYDICVNNPCSEDDYMYMRILGYRLIRMPMSHRFYNPESSSYDQAFIQNYKNSVRWAAKYGLNTIFELHYIPESIMKEKISPSGSVFYDALECETFLADQLEYFAELFSENPSVCIFEVPTNEPYLKMNCRRTGTAKSHSIAQNDFLMGSWNRYLKEKYHRRRALADAWTGIADNTGALTDCESWDNQNILPPGDTSCPMAFNPRLYDYILWFAKSHSQLSERLAARIKSAAPGKLVCMNQATQSAIFSLDAARLDGIFLFQNVPENIDLVSIHYNLGEAKRLSSLAVPGYFGEEYSQEEDKWKQAWEENEGLLPWGWSTRYRKGEDLIDLDENGYLWKDKRFLAFNQKKFLSYPPRKPREALILTSKRLVCRGEHNWKEASALLDSMGIVHDVLDQDLVADNPRLLGNYRFAIFENKYADADALENMIQAAIPTLFYGEMLFDSHAKIKAGSLYDIFARNKLFFAAAPEFRLDAFLLNLQGRWEYAPVDENTQERIRDERLMFSQSSSIAPDIIEDCKELERVKEFRSIHIPGTEETRELKRFWLKRRFVLPEQWSIADAFFVCIGGIDDYDWTFINDRLIGGTQIAWNQRWRPHRLYPLPAGVLRPGMNELAIRVQVHSGLHGIWEGPVALLRSKRGVFTAKDKTFAPFQGGQVSLAPYTVDLTGLLTGEAEVLATCDDFPFLIRQDKKFLLASAANLGTQDPVHRKLIETIGKSL